MRTCEEPRWAVVLGASCGTGAAIARAVAENPGLNLFGVHRGNHPESADAVARDVEAAGRRAVFRCAEAGTAEAARDGAEALLEVAGPRSVQLFVHSLANASVVRLASGDERQASARRVEKTFSSMAHSFIYWTQELLARDLLAPGAQVLGLSNPMEDQVVAGTALIAATKAALGVYVRHLAHELGPRGYRVNLLKFGAVETPAMRATFGPSVERLRGMLGEVLPARRLCRIEEVAHLVALLAGPELAWFNGATIDFTGGEMQGLFDALVRPRRREENR